MTNSAWLDSLAAENGRLLVLLTSTEMWGGFLLITRRPGGTQRYSAQFIHHVGIIPCIGGRDPEAAARLKEALGLEKFNSDRFTAKCSKSFRGPVYETAKFISRLRDCCLRSCCQTRPISRAKNRRSLPRP